MLLGARYIKVNITTTKCDFVRKEKYYAVKHFYRKYDLVQIECEYDIYEITFKIDGIIRYFNCTLL